MAVAEQVAELTCPAGHSVEVHWQSGQKATHWQCPACLEAFHTEELAAAVAANPEATAEVLHTAVQDAGVRAHERSLVKFRGGR